MDFQMYLELAVAGVAGLLAMVGAFVVGVKTLGAIIPGKDPVEKFGDMLDEKVAPIIETINKATDLLNPKTHGGAGRAAPEDE